MTVTIRTPADPAAFARFVWSDDMETCDVTALGFSDDEIDMMIEKRAHEGSDLAGYNVTLD